MLLFLLLALFLKEFAIPLLFVGLNLLAVLLVAGFLVCWLLLESWDLEVGGEEGKVVAPHSQSISSCDNGGGGGGGGGSGVVNALNLRLLFVNDDNAEEEEERGGLLSHLTGPCISSFLGKIGTLTPLIFVAPHSQVPSSSTTSLRPSPLTCIGLSPSGFGFAKFTSPIGDFEENIWSN